MASQATYLRELHQTLLKLRRSVESDLYYIEAEMLKKVPAPGQWSVLEILEHINLVNYFYIEQIEHKMPQLPTLDNDEVKHSWLGSKAIESMLPKKGRIRFKMSTFKKTDPVRLQDRGERTLVPNVVLRDFISGIEKLLNLIEEGEDKQIRNHHVRMLIPLLRLNILDALGFLVAHTERHIQQAKNTLEKINS